MLEILRRELIYFWFYFSVLFNQIAVYWIFGMFVGSLVSVLGKKKLNAAFLAMRDKKLGLLGLIPAALIGVASPLCMFGTIPICASFARKGMREDYIAAFMMSSILLNPQLIFYSLALGKTVFIIRLASCFLCGLTAGLLVRLLFNKKSFFDFKGFDDTKNRDVAPNIFVRFLANFWRNIKATAPMFIIGLSLAALFQRFVSPSMVVALFGGDRAFGLLMAASVGVPLYVCGGGTIPMLLSWLKNGMSLGAATSFMITGPAMKITNVGALKIVLGLKHFLFYILFAVSFALLSGALVNIVFSVN